MKPEQHTMITHALKLYGATIDEDNVINRNGATGVQIVIKGKRMRFQDAKHGHLYMSGPVMMKTVSDFVTGFWYWNKI